MVIIGGGISGLSSAYYLLKEGFEVTVIEKGGLTTGASNINAGYTTPSHIIPLAAPGMINKGLKWMWNSSSPFYIKPRLDLEFLEWAWKFKRSSTKEKVERSIPVLKEINRESKVLYEELLGSLDFKVHYEQKGLLTVYRTEKAAREEIDKGERISRELLSLEVLSRNEVLKLQPELSTDILGAVYYTCDSHSTPNDFMKELSSWLTSKGVKFRINEKVVSVEVEGKKLTGIKTDKDFYVADSYVMAAGSWTQQLLKPLGIKLSLQGGKGYSMDVSRITGITIPTILSEAKVAVTPMKNFTRFAGTMEFSGNNDRIAKNRVEAIARAANLYYKNIELTPEEKNSAQSGLRPVSPDGLPYIGKTSRYDNLIIAAGHAMIGWSLGAVTGKIVSQIATGQRTLLNLDPFNPDRSF